MARGRPSKKAHIIVAASDLFTKYGYQSTSIDQVVLTAEVSKPTVYSNFPTKLALWEAVIISLTERAEDEMGVALSNLRSAKGEVSLISGWTMLWNVWVAKQERLAVYRVFLGELYKMSDSSVALFDQLEAVLESTLADWLEEFNVPFRTSFELKAISKAALLMPALLKQEVMEAGELTKQLEWSLNKK